MVHVQKFSTLRITIISALFLTILISKLNLNSFCIILLALCWLYERNFREKISTLYASKIFWFFLAFFAVQVYGFFLGENSSRAWKGLESKAGLIVLPILFLSGSFPSAKERKIIMTIYSILMTLFLLFMLAIAGYKFLMERDPGIFFYHELLLPVHQNAIYISGFTYISFCFILFEGKNLWPSQQFIRWRSAWLMLLFCFLLLLSSKLIISITFVTLIIAFYRIAAEKKRSPLILTVSLIIFSLTFISSIILTPPINKRFKEIIQTDYKKITQEKFDPNTYFSGLEFRLLLWRFGFDIAEHENTLLFGVGPSNSQPLLQKKYLEMNMYSGEKGTDNVGYLSFNYHNQYLQTLVDSGLVGLAVLLLLCASMVKMAFSSGTVVLKCISLLIIIMFLTESMLERQYGIILTLVPYLIYYPSSKYKTSKYAYTTSIPQTP